MLGEALDMDVEKYRKGKHHEDAYPVNINREFFFGS
jgi:hypothetical protein